MIDHEGHQIWLQLVKELGFDLSPRELNKILPTGKIGDERFFIFQSVDISTGTFFSYAGHPHPFPVSAYTLMCEDNPNRTGGKLKNPIVHHTLWANGYEAWLYHYGSRHTTPTLLKARAILDPYVANDLYASALELRIPLFNVDMEVVPGDDHHHHVFLPLGSFSKPLHLQWWNEAPARWIALTDWLSRAKAYFRQYIDLAPVDDPRTHSAALLQSESNSWYGGGLVFIGSRLQPPAVDALRAFEATLPVPLPIDYRLLFDAEMNGVGDFHIRYNDYQLTFFSIGQIQEHRTNESIPKTVSHEGQAQHVIPFAQDQQGLLLMELTDAKRVWRMTPEGLQIEAETLVSLVTSTIRRLREIALEAMDLEWFNLAKEQRRKRQES
jgi:hypothetical protein